MTSSVFLSHNHKDKEFVRKLARDLEGHGIRYWLDEAEMTIGDSLIQKIREGIDSVDYFAVVLSENSVDAPWVVNELDVAMNHQINGKKIKVLPLLLDDSELPGFLVGKLYGDFKKESEYLNSFKNLTRSIGVVYNKNVMNSEPASTNFGSSLDKTYAMNLPIMSAPFHRPFQYIGLSIQKVEEQVGAKANDVGNIIVENDLCKMVLWAEGNFINFVEVDILSTAPHNQDQEFDSEPLLGALSVGIHELDLERKKTHCHTYSDHRKRLKVTVSCLYDGSPLSVSFGSKYYGM